MNSIYSAKWQNIFYYIFTIQLVIKYLSVVHIVIHNSGKNGDIHRSLKYCI